MQHRTLFTALAGLALLGGSLHATAADYSFSGHLAFNTSIVKIEFQLIDDASGVQLWTNSFESGNNFDPSLALWQRSGPGYVLLAEVDDDETLDVGAGQTDFDAGIDMDSLSRGRYLVTLTASPNYANGTLLSDGFAFDGETPLPIPLWNQPGYDINANDQKGSFWRLNLGNVDSAAPVPESGTYVLLAFGLVALWLVRRSGTDR
jgi:hypothetical protein